MTKPSPPKPPKRAAPAPAKSKNPFALNPNFNRQTRKVLGKHYRANAKGTVHVGEGLRSSGPSPVTQPFGRPSSAEEGETNTM